MPIYRLLKNLLPLLLLTACATMPTAVIDYQSGTFVETLSSAVSISIHTSDRSMSGSGYLLFRRPDQLHLVVLSPFGTTMMEVFAVGERIALIYPSSSTAYLGNFDELPDIGGLQGWRLMRWIMDADPSPDKSFSKTVERINKLGFSEKVTFENGLVKSKESSAGDQVYYSNYLVAGGVPVAMELELRNMKDDRIRIKLDEPEVNEALEEAVFEVRLEGMTILPLSALKGL